MKVRTHKDFKVAVEAWKERAKETAKILNNDGSTADNIYVHQMAKRKAVRDHSNERHWLLIEGLNAIKRGNHGPTWAKTLLDLLEYAESNEIKCSDGTCNRDTCRTCYTKQLCQICGKPMPCFCHQDVI